MVHHYYLEEDLQEEYFQIHLIMLHLYLNHFHLQIHLIHLLVK
jgi:hypothetical protein